MKRAWYGPTETWVRPARRSYTPAEYACAVERKRVTSAIDYAMLVCFVAFVVAVAWGVL